MQLDILIFFVGNVVTSFLWGLQLDITGYLRVTVVVKCQRYFLLVNCSLQVFLIGRMTKKQHHFVLDL